jgi:DNA-binding NtrC family response regulator
MSTSNKMQQPPGKPIENAAPVAKPAVRVLLADPSRVIREVTADALKDSPADIQFLEAETGEQVLAALRTNKIDLAFVDVQMSGISGIDAVGTARNEGFRPFLLLTSGVVLPNWAMVSTDLFAYEFLKKPFASEDIVNALKSHLRMRVPTRILIAESLANTRAVVRKIVSANRFSTDIDETDNGGHALKMARLKTYDIAMIDIGLAGVSGLETACQMQSRHPNMTVVMTMAGADPALAASLRHLGLENVLRKPFFTRDIEVLLHQINGLRRPYLLNAVAEMDRKMNAAS